MVVSDQSLPNRVNSTVIHILLLTAILVVALVFLVKNPAITGRYFAPAEDFSASINEKFSSDSSYAFEIPQEQPYNLKSLKLSGSFLGEGSAKIFLKTENETYLIFDSANIQTKSETVSDLITGALTEVASSSLDSRSSENSDSSSSDTTSSDVGSSAESSDSQGSAEPESQPSSEPLTDAQEESVPDTTDSDSGAELPAPAEGESLNESPPQETVLENQTIESPPVDETKELAFTDACEETCILPDGLADSTYTLEIQVENGELTLSGITYSLQNLTDIPVSINIEIVDSKGEPVAADISLVDDAGKSVIAEETTGQTVTNEIFAPPANEISTEGNAESFEIAPGNENNLVVDVAESEDIPIQSIEFEKIDATSDVNAVIGVDNVPETAVPEVNGVQTAEVYAVDPTQLDFATATITVTAAGSALYKCASWDFQQQSCTDGNWTFVQAITPGQPYEITLTQGDPAYSETQQPNGAGKDSFIQGAYPARNQGASTDLEVRTLTTKENALIEFNLTNISSSATITSAILTLYAETVGVPGDTAEIGVYRITNSWVEGTGSGSQTNDGVTWNNRSGTQTWTTAGGDYDAAAFTKTNVTVVGYYTWDITNLMRGWINGTWTNNGLILADTANGISRKSFTSGDGSNATNRPKLIVNYTTALNISLVSPTPDNASTMPAGQNWVYVNASMVNGPATEANLEWAGTNYTMSGSGSNWYYNKTGLTSGTYTYKVYANDSGTNVFYVSETRTVTVNADIMPPTVTIIRPENITYNTQSNLPLNYTATDNIAVDKCWYAINGGTNTSLPGCSNATFSTGIDGSYPIRVYANDTNGNVGGTVQYFTVDTLAPQWSSPNTNTPTTYSESTPSLFNITWTGSPSSVLLESNYTGTAQNYSMYVISSSVYGYDATLPAGTFYWKSYANDSAGNMNVSSTQTFTINKASATTQLYIDGAQTDKTITYGTQTNATATTSVGSVTLYRDGVSKANPEIITLAAGIYNYTATTSGNENYTSNSQTYFLTINKATPALDLLIDGIADNKTIAYGTQSNATASESNSDDSDVVYNLYRNDVLVSNPDVKTLAANTYVYTYNTSGGENYTSASISKALTVDKAAVDVKLFLNGNEGDASQTYGTASNATATIDVAGLTVQLSRDGISKANPEVATLAAGYYNYTANFAGNENYTGDGQTYFLNISKAASVLGLWFNGIDSDISVPVATSLYINASSITPSGENITLTDGSINMYALVPAIGLSYGDVGDRVWRENISETENYTAGAKNHTIHVTDPNFPQYSNLKENPADPATYYPTHAYQFNATWTDNVGVSNVILEFNGINYSLSAGQLSKSGDEYYKTFDSLAAGSYSYKWYANDTSNNWESTPLQTYTIDKAITALFLTTTPSSSVSYGTTTIVSCSANNLESSPTLTRNTTSVSNPDSGILSVGIHNYACTAGATQNYTSASTTTTLTVNKAAPTINLTLNGADSDLILPAGGGDVEMIATLAAPPNGDLNLTQDGTLINSGASPLVNTSSFATGTYTILSSFSGNDNYTSGSKSHTITVQAQQQQQQGGSSHGGGTAYVPANVTNTTIPTAAILPQIPAAYENETSGSQYPEYGQELLSGAAIQISPYKAPNPLYAVPTLLLLILLFTILAIKKEHLSERAKKMLLALHIALIVTIITLLVITFAKTPLTGAAVAIPSINVTIPVNKFIIGIPAFLTGLTLSVLVWLLHLRAHGSKKIKL